MAKVSIIVPVYNTARYLRRSMDALTGQTLQDIEIIVINDGSTDDSVEIINEYIDRYPDKIRLISKENGGQGTARNIGIKEAVGEYIGFADSDDCVDTAMFEAMYNVAVRDDADLVECSFHYVYEHEDGSRDELKPRGVVGQHHDNRDMFLNPQVSPWNKLYKASILKDNDITFPEGLIYEDTSFYIKSIPYLHKTSYIDEKYVYYFLRGQSTMNSNKGKRVADIFRVIDDMVTFYKANGFYDEYEEELEYFCSKILLCSSLSRIGRINDRKLRNELLDKTCEYIKANFPQYLDNRYYGGKVGMYVKTVRRWNMGLYAPVLGRVMKG